MVIHQRRPLLAFCGCCCRRLGAAAADAVYCGASGVPGPHADCRRRLTALHGLGTELHATSRLRSGTGGLLGRLLQSGHCRLLSRQALIGAACHAGKHQVG
jgi:hypothetical protein